MVTKYLKQWGVAAMAVVLTVACSDSIDVAHVDEAMYETSNESVAFITDKHGLSQADSLMFNEHGSTDFYVNLAKPAEKDLAFTLSYDAAVLERYNAKHNTTIQALPKNLIQFDGNVNVKKAERKSAPVKIAYKSDEALQKNGVYAIPLKLTGDVKASEEKGEFVLLLRDITKMPNCHKEGGLQVISCMEINDANPLYNLCFTLEKSGKYFFDQVILFSGNINYNPETHEVYNFNNENISAVLNFREKYLAPLQQKGMKVILGILGNHDRAGVTNLSDEGCKHFAQELKNKVEAYQLDGVFFDDEYSNPGNYPGFVQFNNFSRLVYECKKAMPDKLMEAYVYSGTSRCSQVNDMQPVDFAIHDYGGNYDLSENYPGLSKQGMIMSSMEFARGRSSSRKAFENIKKNGYGGTMIFALAPHTLRLEWMNRVAEAFYGERVVVTGSYSKDW
ncbi:MAG: BT_3987 domain-containing protein [Hoylesella buccalis]